MATFSQQQHSLLVDSVFFPNSPFKNSGFLDEFFPNWTQFCPSSGLPLPHLEGSSIDASNHESSCLINNDSSVTQKQGTQSLFSMAGKAESGEQVTQVCSPVDSKKRKSRPRSSSNSANSKVAKGKKHKGDEEAKKDGKNDKKDENKANTEEPPKGYIHVRARRGQATDSHSLAERVRREKISERMKTLQALVPGCHKVIGKALMLDEIINYVQSLQNQVEFLSMRLASLDPTVYNFGLIDLDPITPFGAQGIMNHSSMALPMPPIQPPTTAIATTSIGAAPSMGYIEANTTTASATSGGAIQPPTFIDANAITATTTTTTSASIAQPLGFIDTNAITTMATSTFPSPVVVDSSANLFEHEQKPSLLPLQDDKSLYWGLGVNDQQRLSFYNQFDFGANN